MIKKKFNGFLFQIFEAAASRPSNLTPGFIGHSLLVPSALSAGDRNNFVSGITKENSVKKNSSGRIKELEPSTSALMQCFRN
jgi:hypothetical protein